MTSTSGSALGLPASRRSSAIETALLAWVLEGISQASRFNVLEVGPARPRTIGFFNAKRCRIHIADLFSSRIIKQQHLDQDTMTARFEEALWMVDEPLQACLLWDFPNYLSPSALVAFSRALRPWVTPATRAHAFCAVKRSAPLMQHQYDILSANEVGRTTALRRPPAPHPHSWQRLARALDSFDVTRGALRTGGLVEVILQGASRRSAQPPLRTKENVKDTTPLPPSNPEQRSRPARRTSLNPYPSPSQFVGNKLASMFVGVHGDYPWELSGGELRVSSANPRLGPLKCYPPRRCLTMPNRPSGSFRAESARTLKSLPPWWQRLGASHSR